MRLRSYPQGGGEVTKSLYAFGSMLLAENQQRAGSLDAKATNMVGYAGVILSFLVANAPDWSLKMQALPRALVGFATICALLGAIAAACAMWSRRWRWFSDEEWLSAEAITDAEKLTRYHVLAIHDVNQNNGRVNHEKAGWVVLAQVALAGATALLAAALSLHLLAPMVTGS